MNSGVPPGVAICIRGLGRGGAERLAVQEAVYLAGSATVEVWYQVYGEFIRDLEGAGVPTLRLHILALRRNIKRLREATGSLVVHTHSPSFGSMLRLASIGLRRVRFVHTEHNVMSSYRIVTRVSHRLTSSRIEELIAVSHAVLKTAPRTKRARVLHHVDLTSERMEQCLSVHPKTAGQLRILCVASMTTKKDHANLFDALNLIVRHVPPLTVLLVGDGPTRGKVAARAEELMTTEPRVTVELCGVRDDIPTLLAEADVLVLPSRAEGLPLIVMEAMAASTPVVSTAVGGVPEIVRHEQTGLLVPPGDPHALARELTRVLSDASLRGALGLQARQKLQKLGRGSWLEDCATVVLGAPP